MTDHLNKQAGPDAVPAGGWVRTALIGRNPRRTLVRAAVLAGVCLLVFNFILLPVRVEGISMLPTYHTHSIRFINRLSYLFREPRRGDIVGIRYSGRHLMLMKRIVGLPGETVAFRQGAVVINGHVLEEPYLKFPCDWDIPPETVGPNEYFVVGDNRSMSWQDHEMGRASRERLMGRVFP
jgi:signal peptidase I